MGGPAPPQPPSDNLGPSHRTYTMCSSVNSPELPRPRGTSQSGDRYYLCLSLLVHIWLCFEESSATKNQPPEAKTQPGPSSVSPSLPGEGHRKATGRTTLAPCLLSPGQDRSPCYTRAACSEQEPMLHQGCFGSTLPYLY